MTEYVALLRGINVGGNNLIKMIELKACFEVQGFTRVSTYIQSGNVLFAAEETDTAKLTKQIEATLDRTFHFLPPVVLCSRQQLEAIVRGAPKGFGSQPDKFRYDVIFLKEPLAAAKAMQSISLKEGVDTIAAGAGVLYFRRLIAKATSSHLNRIVGMSVYKSMTIRNWNTTTKLLHLLEAAE